MVAVLSKPIKECPTKEAFELSPKGAKGTSSDGTWRKSMSGTHVNAIETEWVRSVWAIILGHLLFHSLHVSSLGWPCECRLFQFPLWWLDA